MLQHHKSEPVLHSDRVIRRQQSLAGTAHTILMNTKSAVAGIGYNVCGYLNEMYQDPIDLGVDECVWLCVGDKTVGFTDTVEFYTHWNSLIRITYTKNWPEPILNPKTQVVYESDTGWGCTIRCAQMLLANIFQMPAYCGNTSDDSIQGNSCCAEMSGKTYCGKATSDNSYCAEMSGETYCGKTPVKATRTPVCEEFNDRSECQFSIHQFINFGDKFAGEWFGPTSVAIGVCGLLSSQSNLGSVRFVDGRICMREVLAAASQPPPRSPNWTLANEWTEAQSPGGFVRIAHHEWAETQSPDVEHFGDIIDASVGWTRPVLILCTLRTSPDTLFPPELIPVLLAYMKISSFVGILGGPEGRCFFINGLLHTTHTTQHRLLAIDPHIVHESSNSNFQPNSVHPTQISPNELCPSMCVSFLVTDQTQMNLLQTQMNQIEFTHQTSAFITVSNDSQGINPQRYPDPKFIDGDDLVLI